MKKLVLFIMMVMAFAGLSVAQEVWSCGYYTDSDGKTQGAVYKNETKVYTSSFISDLQGKCSGLNVYQGDVYWANNCYNADGTFNDAKIMKNSTSYSVGYFGEGAHIYDISRQGPNHTLFAVGCKNVGGVKTAARWRNNEQSVIGLMGDGYYPSEAYSLTGYVTEGTFWVYSVGCQYTSESTYKGVMWKGNDVFNDFGEGTKVFGITYWEGYFYSVGVKVSDGNTSLNVWQTDADSGTTVLLYTLADNLHANYADERFSIFVDDAGDLYVNGMLGGIDKVWKNQTELYSTGNYFTSVAANTEGVFYSGSQGGAGVIWMDGEELFWPTDCERITDLFVSEPECVISDARTLPYFEGFETGATDWACWTKEDVDNENTYLGSYWHRAGEKYNPNTGDYCAWHSYGPRNVHQEGWLASPYIAIPEDGSVKLSFNTFEENVDDYYEYEGVWVFDGENKTEVWSQPADWANDSWKLVEIDLSAFMGREVQIAFKYSGTYAHTWYIDDVSITQEEGPAPTTYSLTVMCNSSEGTTVGTGSYVAGSTVTIAAIPNEGFEFDKWNDENTENPREVTVNSDMVFVAFFKGTGLGENGGRLIALYPNPANNFIRLDGLDAETEVKVYNAMGALVKVFSTNPDEDINIADLASGLYVVRCGNITLRFVKE